MAVAGLRATFAEVALTGFCSHPVRVSGRIADLSSGEIGRRELAIACKDRRAVVCPACSRRYQEDAFQLVAAGLRGGKGVPEDVATYPRLFVTLTAPSFGAVHSRRTQAGRSMPCHPRRATELCSHGKPLDCRLRHGADEELLGDPVCPECFDYEAAVLWNASVSLLWQRTTVATVRALGGLVGQSERRVRQVLRLSYVKGAEFQRRGLVHLHVVVRADGSDGPESSPPTWCDTTTLSEAIRAAASGVTVQQPLHPGERFGWGGQLDVLDLTARDVKDSIAAASYTAKYATKTVDDAGLFARPIRSLAALDALPVRAHLANFARAAIALAGEPALSDLRLAEHAHTLGFRGHVQTKSVRYSTTFGALRAARAAYARSGEEPTIPTPEPEWDFAGRGYESPDAARLARALAIAGASRRHDHYGTSTGR